MTIEFWTQKEYPPKVIAMNEAVISLLEEGRDLSSLKVSEITTRAGIGKGTAYEYFKSKAEIIVSAMEYDLNKQIVKLFEMETNAKGFREMMEILMNWVAESFKNHSVFTYLFRNDTGFREMTKELETNTCPFEEGKHIVEKMIEKALIIGEQEGIIKKMDPYFGGVAIFSQLFSFTLYLGNLKYDKVTEDEAKEFAVNSIIKMLN